MKKISLLLCLGIFLLAAVNSPAADISISEASSECIDCHASVHPGKTGKTVAMQILPPKMPWL
jgi:hypothetical protein